MIHTNSNFLKVIEFLIGCKKRGVERAIEKYLAVHPGDADIVDDLIEKQNSNG